MNHSEQERSVLEQELELLLQKKERHQLTRADILRIMALNWQLYGEIDNYEKFLRPEEAPRAVSSRLASAQVLNR